MSNLKAMYDSLIDHVTEITNPKPYEQWVKEHTKLNDLPFSTARYPFQKQILNDMHINMDVIKCSQIGLPLSLKTKVFSTQGWKELGEIKVGDYVYTPKGEAVKVVYLSPIEENNQCYQLTFCDGTTIVADEKHRWFVHSDKAFNLHGLYPKSGRIPVGSDYATFGRITTKAIFENYKGKGSRSNVNIFYIPCTQPIETIGFELFTDPYVLGLWLGNGSRSPSRITTFDGYLPETISILESKGFTVTEYKSPNKTEDKATALCLYKDGKTLHSYIEKNIDCGANKYFKPEWLLLSIEDRFELLQGLIDSDGSVSKSGRIEFYNTSKSLADGFFQLAASLGFKPRFRVRKVKGKVSTLKNGKYIHSKNDLYVVHFLAYSDVTLSKLSSKQGNLKTKGNGTRATEPFQRRIVDVRPVASEPVRCIMVDDAEHQFLCSEAFITTSNTEIQIRKALAMAYRNQYKNIIFSLPDEPMRDRISSTRVKTILANNPIFSEGVTRETTRSVEITQIKNSFVLWLPATEKSATSQAADAVLNDEVDLSDQKILALFNSRMQASDWKLNQRFSTPTYLGYGIDQSFKLSDQHLYMYKCPHCNQYQHPEFKPEYISFEGFPFSLTEDFSNMENDWVDKYKLDFSKTYVRCKKCGRPADLGNSSLREWVATFPDRKHHRGYRITPFSTQQLNPQYIFTQLLKYKKDDFIRGWYNTVLGVPYEGGKERLSRAELNSLFTGLTGMEEYDPNFEYFIGYDVGSVCYITVSKTHPDHNKETKYIWFETVKNGELQDRIVYLVNKYNIKSGNGDKYPEQKMSSDIREATNGVVLPTRYENTKASNPLTYKEDDYGNIEHCVLQRTWNFDNLVYDIRNGFVNFSGYGNFKETIIFHLMDMVRVDKPESVPIWEKLSGQDHFFHACVYCYAAQKRFFEGDTSTDQKVGLIFGGLDVNLYNMDRTLFGGKRR